MSAAEGAAIRPARPGDYPAIAELLDRTFGGKPYAQRLRLWTWRYDENPARTGAFPPFLVFEDAGRIRGVHGLIPLRLTIDGREIEVSCSCDLAVDPSCRSAGLKLKLAAMSKQLSSFHLSTSANEAANRITLALGGREVPLGRRKHIKPLKASGLMMRTRKRRGGAGRLLATLEAAFWRPVDWGLAIRRGVSMPGRSGTGLVRDVTFFDARFDRFWEGAGKDGRILVVRDAAYLNWRYARYPFRGVECFELIRSGELAAFGVIHHSLDEDGLRFAALLELETRPGEDAAVKRLVAEAVRRAARAGAHYLIARAATPEREAACRAAGFVERSTSHSSVTYKVNSDAIREDVLSNAMWCMSLGDGDGCHYFEESQG